MQKKVQSPKNLYLSFLAWTIPVLFHPPERRYPNGMSKNRIFGAFVFLLVLWAPPVLIAGEPAAGQEERPPNVVLIMADDLGLAELGCTGSERIETPNIDRLRERGMLFTQAYSGSTVCAPSRCTLLTGLHTGASQIRDNGETPNFSGDPGTPGTEELSGWTQPPAGGWWGGQRGMVKGTETIATALKRRGYATYMAGKWGLGGPKLGSMPTDHGFDGFIGYLCQRNAHNFYPTYIVEDGDQVLLDGNDRGLTGRHYSTDLMVDRATAFIRDHADEPFFLYYATPVPHLALQVPDDSLAAYAGRWEETPYQGGKGYLPNATPRATYAAMVSRFDRNVGLMMDALEKAGVADDTLVIVTSDNGSTFGIGGYDPPFFDGTGGHRGHKCNLYEGGIRVPLIATWPNRIKAGSSDDTPVANWDLMPTILSLAGVAPTSEVNGIDVSPLLLSRGPAPERDHLYWEYHAGGGLQAVRMNRWKGVRNGVHRDADVPVELYDLEIDPTESSDVASDHPEIAAQILEIMRKEHSVSAVPGWNFGWNDAAPVKPRPDIDVMEIGPGLVVRKQFVNNVEVVIDGGTLALSGPGDRLNGATVRFTRAGGALILERHTPDEFRRKHGSKMRAEDGQAVEGRDYQVVARPEGGCEVTRIRESARAAAPLEARLDLVGEPGFSSLAATLADRNPGTSLAFAASAVDVPANDGHRVVFVQRGETEGEVITERGRRIASLLRVGDLLALRPGDVARFDAPVDILSFGIAEPLDDSVPSIIRPDFDPALTDAPGGCATDPGAYRRLLLTWDLARGPYVNRGFNCHRVRIDDSFTHYHPLEGGWDEIYLVQEAPDGAQLLVCRETDRLDREQLVASGSVTSPQEYSRLSEPEIDGLFESIPLHAGSLVLLPRGLAHRGLGGAVVQVIAVPGFRPGFEIPLDGAIQRLNGRFLLTGERRLPLHKAGVDRPRPQRSGDTP